MHRERRTEAKTDSNSNDRIFQKLKYVYWKVGSIKVCLSSNWWERVSRSPRTKKSKLLVNLDRFSKFLKYFKYFERWSKSTKNLDFFTRGEHTSLSSFWGKLGYSQTKFDRKIYHFIVDSLLKDAVITVGVSLHLCLLSLCIYESLQYIQICQWRHCTLGWMHAKFYYILFDQKILF